MGDRGFQNGKGRTAGRSAPGSLAQLKADAARNAATSLGGYFGDATLNPALNDITAASEAELKYLFRRITALEKSLIREPDQRRSSQAEGLL